MSQKSAAGWERFLKTCVVVDTNTPLVYIGTLKRLTKDVLQMENTDVHDSRDGASTKETYIWNTRKHGIRPNRKSVLIKRESVVSISALDDVIEY